jgi:hypothetical protein
LLKGNDFTRRLTTDENRALKEELTLFPLLDYKLQLLVCLLRNGQRIEKIVCQVASSKWKEFQKNHQETHLLV